MRASIWSGSTGKILRQLPLIERKEKLQELILSANNPALVYADHVEHYGSDFFRMICEKNLEGIVLASIGTACRTRRHDG